MSTNYKAGSYPNDSTGTQKPRTSQMGFWLDMFKALNGKVENGEVQLEIPDRDDVTYDNGRSD